MNPTTSFDFTTAALDPRITFARSGATATRVNSSGYIESVAADTARFDFSQSLACRGLLLEETRQNLHTYSEDFRNSTDAGATRPWVYGNTTLTLDTVTAPNQATDVYRLAENTASGVHSIAQTYSPTTTQTYTFSIFAKVAPGSKRYAQLWLGNGATGSVIARFDLDLGTRTQNAFLSGSGFTAVAADIAPYKNGFYRIWLTATKTTTTGSMIAQFRISTLSSGTENSIYTGDGSSGFYIFGSQLEVGAFPTSYIPTTTTAVTRNADVATITGTAFSGFWRSGPGSILVRALPSTVSGTRPLVQVDDATADNIIALRGNTTNPELYIRAGGSDQATIDAGTISVAAYRLAGAWQAGSAAASLNSGLAVNGAPASIPAVTQMRLGSDGTNYLNGHLQSLEYWPLRLSNAGLQTASSTTGYQSIIHPVSRDTIITEPV